MSFLFVLKDKGTKNQGWWLKISTIEQLTTYYETIISERMRKVFENYRYGKEWNNTHPAYKNDSHCPYMKEAAITDAIVKYGEQKHISIQQAIKDFQTMIATQQMESIQTYGAIYINKNGGYHHADENDIEYAFIHRDTILFPDFKKEEIRISQFPNGKHFYAHIGDLEVKDGNIIKWNTYEEAYQQALSILEQEK